MTFMGVLCETKDQIIRKLSCVSEGVYIVAPEVVGQAYHKKQDMYQFPRDPHYLKNQVNTVADLILYVRASFFRPHLGDVRLQEGNITWHFNRTGPETICANKGNCGGVSSMFTYLLHGKYEEVGFMAFTDVLGGHVFNYIKHHEMYYFVDLLNYLYASNTRENHSTVIYQADSLKRYADYYRQQVKKDIKIMVAYQGVQVLPIGRVADKPLMFFPEGSHCQVLLESPQEGIVAQEGKVTQCPPPLNNCVSYLRPDGIPPCEG